MEIACSRCGLMQHEDNFYRHNWRARRLDKRPRVAVRNYRSAWCKPCKKLYDRERRKNPAVLEREKECHANAYRGDFPRHWAWRQSARARKYGVVGVVSWEEWQEVLSAHENKCHWCQRDLHISFLTLDHVKPLSEGGAHSKDNVVPACANCNHVRLWELKTKYRDIDRNPML